MISPPSECCHDFDISTAGGDQAAANANAAMVHVVHALRGIVAPLMVGIPKSWQHSEGGEITDESYGKRLDDLGQLVVDLAGKLKLDEETAGDICRSSADI